MWRRPEDVREKQPVWYLLAEDSPADLAAQITAGIVSGTLALYKNQQMGVLQASTNVNKAHRLFRSSLLAPTIYTSAANVTSTPIAWHYPSNSYLDDLFWASTWMLRASQQEYGAFREYNSTYYYTATRMIMDLSFAERDNMEVSSGYLNNVALVHAATITKDWQFHSAAQSWIWDWICSGDVTYTTFGRAYHPESPMLGNTALAAAIAAVYVHSAEKWELVSQNKDFMTGACVLALQCSLRALSTPRTSLTLPVQNCRVSLLCRGPGPPVSGHQLSQAPHQRLQQPRLPAPVAPWRLVPRLPCPLRHLGRFCQPPRQERAQRRPAVAARQARRVP